VSSYTRIRANNEIIVQDVGDECTFTCFNYGVWAKNIGSGVHITANEGIKVHDVGEKCTLTSSNYGVKAKNIGSGTHITANGDIEVHDVGEKCALTSSNYGVKTECIGSGTRVTANNDVSISGTCPNPHSLILYSKNGKFHRPKEGSGPILKSPTTTQTSSVPSTSKAVASSNTLLSRLFQAPKNINPMALNASQANNSASQLNRTNEYVESHYGDKKKVEIPRAFECSITHKVMREPVILILDGKSYDKQAITEWLQKHRSSPSNRIEMLPNQKIEDVLFPNRNLADAIEEFRQQNPDLFSESRLSM
jgi:U-box domain